jgi:geranylgeranyl pyrophosphate synthase
MSSFSEYLASFNPEIEAELDCLLPAASEHPTRIDEAMRYSVFAGGKRIRPALVVMILGRIFQISDDILDCEGSEQALGKTVGKDVRAHKLTYPALHGLHGSRERLKMLGKEALELGSSLTDGDSFWPSLIHYLSSRDH